MISPESVLAAYCQGLFPMAGSARGRVRWYTADPRGVVDLAAFHIPRRLRPVLRRGEFEVRRDTVFEQVIRSCSDRDDTWISEEIIQTYVKLHQMGFAHSVESWKEGKLAGGLYGVALRGAFFGESMFHQVPNASKVALVHLVEHLCRRGYLLLDTQMITPVMASFGAVEVSKEQYLRRLEEALAVDCSFGKRVG